MRASDVILSASGFTRCSDKRRSRPGRLLPTARYFFQSVGSLAACRSFFGNSGQTWKGLWFLFQPFHPETFRGKDVRHQSWREVGVFAASKLVSAS
jgi:hypothetical protein